MSNPICPSWSRQVEQAKRLNSSPVTGLSKSLSMFMLCVLALNVLNWKRVGWRRYECSWKGFSPNPPKRVSIAAGAWVRDVSKWRCGYDVSAWVVLKVRGRDFGRQWRPTVAIWGEFDESAGNSGHPRSGPERSYGQDRLWCVRWSVVDTAVRPAEEWLAVWSVRDRTVFPRASAAGDAK